MILTIVRLEEKMAILELLDKNNILYKVVDCSDDDFYSKFPSDIISYLNCMGREIKINVTAYGSACTTLYSIDEIKLEQNEICTANNLLVVGCGLNGDLLTINVSNSKVGYVFHDELWEEIYDEFEDIYVEMQLSIEEFIRMALEDRNYPIDGFMAEEMFKLS